MTGVIVAVAIVLAISVVLCSVVEGLLGLGAPPSVPHDTVRGIATSVECPATRRVTQLRVGLDPTGHFLAVLRCERFGAGPVECDRGCLLQLG